MNNEEKEEHIDPAADSDNQCPEQPRDGSQGRPTYHTGTTTQGGSDHGQGSSYLGPDAYKQGQTKNDGANYGNEAGRLSELEDGNE